MREADPPRIERYWQLLPEEALARLGSGRQGLSAAEAAARLERHGPNVLWQERAVSALRVLAAQFRSPLVLILVFAAAISLAVRRLRARIALKTACLRAGAAAPVPAEIGRASWRERV